MKLANSKMIITTIATMTAIIFIALSYNFPKHSIFILTIEVILLPTIYIVGNYHIESLLKKEHQSELNNILHFTNILEEKYNNERLLNTKLKKELEFMKKNGKEKKAKQQ